MRNFKPLKGRHLDTYLMNMPIYIAVFGREELTLLIIDLTGLRIV